MIKMRKILLIILTVIILMTGCGKKDDNYTIVDDNYRNFYQIFPYSFADSNGDGIGDIKGIIERLDYLNDNNPKTDSDLEVNGLWLTPIMPAESYHKYDVSDFYSIDPEFGTLEDFKELVEECHERGIAVVIDLVFNHTSTKHLWFEEATTYLQNLGDLEPNINDNQYYDYYNFTNEYNGGGTYHKIGGTDWYYEGVFWGGMPDLNLASQAVRKEIEDIAKYWLDLGVDGFRLDAAKEFYSGEKERNVEVLNWFNEYVKSIKEDAFIVAEVWDSESAISSYYESGILSLFNFPLAQHDGLIVKAAKQISNIDAVTYIENLIKTDESYRKSNTDYIDSPFVSNHDTSRISAQCQNNEDQMKMAAGLLLTMRGSPFIYYGEEIGMNSYGGKDENKRLPMQWSITDDKNMTKGPIDADEVEQIFQPVDLQMEDPLSILNYYKKGIRIRNKFPEIARGETELIQELSSASVAVIKKSYNDKELLIAYNIGEEPAKLSLLEDQYKDLKVVDYLTVDDSKVLLEKMEVQLPKYSILILK